MKYGNSSFSAEESHSTPWGALEGGPGGQKFWLDGSRFNSKKISEIGATRCQSSPSAGLCPRPLLEELTALLQTLYLYVRGLLLRGGQERDGNGG